MVLSIDNFHIIIFKINCFKVSRKSLVSFGGQILGVFNNSKLRMRITGKNQGRLLITIHLHIMVIINLKLLTCPITLMKSKFHFNVLLQLEFRSITVILLSILKTIHEYLLQQFYHLQTTKQNANECNYKCKWNPSKSTWQWKLSARRFSSKRWIKILRLDGSQQWSWIFNAFASIFVCTHLNVKYENRFNFKHFFLSTAHVSQWR